jgi:hypothetical protein
VAADGAQVEPGLCKVLVLGDGFERSPVQLSVHRFRFHSVVSKFGSLVDTYRSSRCGFATKTQVRQKMVIPLLVRADGGELNVAEFETLQHGPRAVPHAKFGQDAGSVCFDGGLAGGQGLRDLLITEACRHETQYLNLSRGQWVG